MRPTTTRRPRGCVAQPSGAAVVTLANSVEGMPEGADDYFALFDVNLTRLLAALGHEE